MNVEFRITFVGPESGAAIGIATLAADLPFAPALEMEFAQPVWHDARKPTSISYNIEDQSFDVFFGVEKLQASEAKAHLAMYGSAGWQVKDHTDA